MVNHNACTLAEALTHFPVLCATNNLYLPGSMKVNTVEEAFGDSYPYGFWSELKKGVPSNIFENVVALASFNSDFTVMCYVPFHLCIQSALPQGSYGV
jgi:hypothetical protein